MVCFSKRERKERIQEQQNQQAKCREFHEKMETRVEWEDWGKKRDRQWKEEPK